VKESNGERTVIDTTFEESSDFDEDAGFVTEAGRKIWNRRCGIWNAG
jgi:hypothetical protein